MSGVGATLVATLRWPFDGLRLASYRPHWWWYTLTGSTGGGLILLGLLLFQVWIHWPHDGWSLSAGIEWAARVGGGLAAILAITLPLLKASAANRVLRLSLRQVGADIPNKGAVRSVKDAARHILATLPIRIAWIILLTWSAVVGSAAGMLVSFWGLGHLVTVSACDASMLLLGLDRGQRRKALWRRAHLILIAGFVVGVLAMPLGITLVGWLIWAPAIAAGAARWVATWPEVGHALPQDLETRPGREPGRTAHSDESAGHPDAQVDSSTQAGT